MSYRSIRIRREVYEKLLEMQALFQYRDKRIYAISDVIAALIVEAPPLELPFDQQLELAEWRKQPKFRKKLLEKP
jgi:hypothetical protein